MAGLYENIRKRRAAGKTPRPPGAKGRPSASDFTNAAKTANKLPKRGQRVAKNRK